MELGSGGGFELEIPAIIIDFGMDYTKMGFSKDPTPRVILKTPLCISKLIRENDEFGITTLANILKDKDILMLEIEEFLKEIFVIHAQVSTKGHTV